MARYLEAMGVEPSPEADRLIGKVLRRLVGRRLEPGDSRAAAALLEVQALVDQWLADCLGPAVRGRRALGAARVALVRCLREGSFSGFVPGLGQPPPALLQAILTGARVGVPPLAHLAMQARPLDRVPDAAGARGLTRGDALVRPGRGIAGGPRR